MSESAAEAEGITGTDEELGEPGTGDAETGEDAEADELLAGMADADPEALRAEIAKWKGLSRQNETRAKANSAAAKELAEIKRAGMSELERAQAEAAEAIRERDEALGNHNRVMAAAAHNLPVEFIDLLGSGTEDEINERAELIAGVVERRAQEIAEQILNRNGINPQSAPLGRPIESMRAGSAPSGSSGTPTTADEWFRHMLDNR